MMRQIIMTTYGDKRAEDVTANEQTAKIEAV